jgi:hypothetical protein
MARPHKSRTIISLAAAAVTMVSATIVGQAATAAHAATGHGRTERVIVMLRNQLSSTPARQSGMAARTARAMQTQAAVLSRLSGPQPERITHYSLANGFAATVDAVQARSLAADTAVASVVRDVRVRWSPAMAGGGGTHSAAAPQPRINTLTSADGPDAICPSNPAQPLVEPEGLRSIGALTTDGSPNAQDLSTGGGVTVGYIADGIDPNNPDFIRPSDGSHVIVDYQDFSGDGPNAPSGGGEAFGDASSIAAQGAVTHDLSNFVNPAHPLPAGCNIRILGVAPDASIVALKAGDDFVTNSAVLQSIDYAVRVDHVDVLNESFGSNIFPDQSNRNTVEAFNDAAVAAGVTVTESTGDGGLMSTISNDAQDPHVISVGATTDNRLYAQTTYGGFQLSNGHWISDNVSALSSGGFTQRGRTADVVAPGETNWAVCDPGFSSCTNFGSPSAPADIEPFSGTSESAPLTAGVAALVISAYRATHNGASPSPGQVKVIITSTADDMGLPPSEQGSGMLDARAATEAAMTWPGATVTQPNSVKSHILLGRDQLTLTGKPGSTQSSSINVTNVGSKPLTVAPAARHFTGLGQAGQATAFDATSLPTFSNFDGSPWAFKALHFHVSPGADRLTAQLAWAGSRPSPTADALVQMTLLAPDGAFVATSKPQGGGASANYATVDVRHPAVGTWTAVLYSPAGSNGYTGVIGLLTKTTRITPMGSVSPAAFNLAPGQSRKVDFSFQLPSSAAGDTDAALTFASSDGGHQSAVGVVLRPLIDTSSGQGPFSGAITGGNARAGTPAQTLSYEFDVPPNAPSLDAVVHFTHNPDSDLSLVLIDPNGELADVVGNFTLNGTLSGVVQTQNIQSYTASPLPGRWVLVVVAQNPVSGTAFDEPFTGSVSFDPVPIDRGGLPDSTSTILARNAKSPYTLTINNTGKQPLIVGSDPRTTDVQTIQPAAIQGNTTFALPPDPSNEPIYEVPPDTSQLTVVSSSTTPAQLELRGSAGGFDVLGDLPAAQSGNTISVTGVKETGAGNYIARGAWSTNMQQIGPFTDAGAPAGQTTITASMRTLGFDQTVSTGWVGDPYGPSVDPNSVPHPVRIPPGGSKTITIAITPTADVGTAVSGLLNIATLPNLSAGPSSMLTTGEVVATLPYSYTVG